MSAYQMARKSDKDKRRKNYDKRTDKRTEYTAGVTYPM